MSDLLAKIRAALPFAISLDAPLHRDYADGGSRTFGEAMAALPLLPKRRGDRKRRHFQPSACLK